MNEKRIDFILKELNKNVTFDSGLSDKEVDMVERGFNFSFPPDLKILLQKRLPVSESFVNWRKALKDTQYRSAIKELMDWPLQGILFDIKNNEFWLDSWGSKPSSLSGQEIIAKQAIAKAPKLVPIFSHRYIPSKPQAIGNPVYQTDIIYYGYDLLGYFANEFGFQIPNGFKQPEQPKKIRFWDDILN